MAEVVLHREIRITKADGTDQPRARRIENCYQREVHSNFAIPEGAIAEFDGLRVLAKTGISRLLQVVELVIALQMKVVINGNVGVVGRERLLRMRRHGGGHNCDDGEHAEHEDFGVLAKLESRLHSPRNFVSGEAGF